jgi:hypothetical protein
MAETVTTKPYGKIGALENGTVWSGQIFRNPVDGIIH